jgi:GNAT superfamily N-acetyltransferase
MSSEVDVRVPPWTRTGSHAHSIRSKIAAWQPILDRGGVLVGAFEAQALVAFAVYPPDLAASMANFAALHVRRSHRREGVGSLLAREVIRLARTAGARWLYVHATPSFRRCSST